MESLHTKILAAARDEVAKRDYNTNFKYVVENGTHSSIIRVLDEAALLAMEKQAEFFRWASEESYAFNGTVWYDLADTLGEQPLTELELYEIWEGQK